MIRVGTIVLATALASVSWADASQDEARRHYQAGADAFNRQDWNTAIAEYQASYQAVPAPLLLYDVALAFQKKGDRDKALEYYDAYLHADPNGRSSKDARDRIAKLRGDGASSSKPSPQGQSAQSPVRSETAGAKEHYQNGLTKYNLQDFDAALNEFKAAYAQVQDPSFLFNIAQCQRNLGQYEAAAKSYRAFLNSAPDATNRAQVEKLIEQMDQAAKDERSRTPPTGVNPPSATTQALRVATAPPPPAIPAPWYRSAAGWSLIGGGAIAIVIGGVLVGHGFDLQNEPYNSLQQQHDLQASATNYSIGGWTVLGVGAGALVSGSVVFGIQQHRRARATSLARREGVQ